MNNKRTKGENVYQLVQKRLKFLFNEFDNIYVSFSGGKDSGVLLNLCIQYIREHNLDRKIGVYHMDYDYNYIHLVPSYMYLILNILILL